jgi:hypothetical protein
MKMAVFWVDAPCTCIKFINASKVPVASIRVITVDSKLSPAHNLEDIYTAMRT